MADIDKLQIEIEASSTDAAKEVNRLADAMKSLKSATATQFNNPIKEIQKSASSPIKADKISRELERVDKEIEKTSKKISELQEKYDVFSDLSAGVGENISGSMAKDLESQLNDLSRVLDVLDAQRRTLMGSLDAKPVIEPQVSEKMSLAEQKTQELIAEIDDLDNRLKEVGITGDKAFSDMTSSEILAMSQAQLLDVRIESIKQKLDKAASSGKVSAGEIAKLAEQVHRLEAQKAKLTIDSSDVTKAEKRVNRLTKLLESIKRIAFYRAIRSGIKSIAEGVTTGVKNLYEWSSIVGGRFKPAMDSLATSALYAKNALGAMIGPILEDLAPAIDWLTDKFVKLTEVISMFYAALTGRGYYYKAIKQSTEFAKETKEAAKAAKSFMLSIDELNVINDATGGAGGAVENFEDMFEKVEMTDDLMERMKKILDIVELIGSALAAWAIGKNLGLDLARIAGLAVAIYETLKFIEDIFDMWRNGVNMNNLLDALKRLALAALGAYVAFGKAGAGLVLLVGGAALFVTSVRDIMENGANLANTLGAIAGVAIAAAGALMLIPGALGRIASGIILVVGGVALFVAGFKDATKNGVNFYNGMLMVAGLLATGIGFGVLTHSFIPVFIGAIAAAGLAMALFTGHGEEYLGELGKAFDGIGKFVQDVFVNKDMKAAGDDLKQIAEGVVNSIIIIFEGAVNLVITGINKLFEKEVEVINKLYNSLPDWLTGGKTLNAQAGRLDLVDLGRVRMTENKGTGGIKRTGVTSRDYWENINNEYAGAGENAASSFMSSFKDTLGGMGDFTDSIIDTNAVDSNFTDMMKNMQNQTEQFKINGQKDMKDFADVSNSELENFKNDIDTYINENADFYKTKLNNAQAHTKNATANMTNAYNSMSNNSVSAIGRIIAALNSIPTNITTVHTIITQSVDGGGSALAPVATSGGIKAYASGGFPEDGLFFANHGELVGSFSNGKTAVANNQEIVAGITAGVENANSEQNALLREQNELLSAILAKTGAVSIDGKTLMTSVERAQRQRGANIMAGGVRA